MLWILPCLLRRKIFHPCLIHLPSHTTGASKAGEGCNFTWEPEPSVAESWKRGSLKAINHCSVCSSFSCSEVELGAPWGVTTPLPSSLLCRFQGIQETTTRRTWAGWWKAGTLRSTPQFPFTHAEKKGEGFWAEGLGQWAVSGDSRAPPAGQGQPQEGRGWRGSYRTAPCPRNTFQFYAI